MLMLQHATGVCIMRVSSLSTTSTGYSRIVRRVGEAYTGRAVSDAAQVIPPARSCSLTRANRVLEKHYRR